MLSPRDLATSQEPLRAWADFYLPDEAHEHREAILEIATRVAKVCAEGEIEIDPWDLIGWLDGVDPRARESAKRGLHSAGFLPHGEVFEVLSFVHSTEQELSLRLFVSSLGFGDRARHFLLRYFLEDAQIPTVERLFRARGAGLWVEGNRVIFSTEGGDAPRAMLAFHDMVTETRLAIAESDGGMVMFCEMPPRIGMLAEMDPWGDVRLRHGVDLFEVV